MGASGHLLTINSGVLVVRAASQARLYWESSLFFSRRNKILFFCSQAQSTPYDEDKMLNHSYFLLGIVGYGAIQDIITWLVRSLISSGQRICLRFVSPAPKSLYRKKDFLYFFFKNIYLLIWLRQVLVAAHWLLVASCEI